MIAGQPYWAPEAGSFRMRMQEGVVELRVSPEGECSVILEAGAPQR